MQWVSLSSLGSTFASLRSLSVTDFQFPMKDSFDRWFGRSFLTTADHCDAVALLPPGLLHHSRIGNWCRAEFWRSNADQPWIIVIVEPWSYVSRDSQTAGSFTLDLARRVKPPRRLWDWAHQSEVKCGSYSTDPATLITMMRSRLSLHAFANSSSLFDLYDKARYLEQMIETDSSLPIE